MLVNFLNQLSLSSLLRNNLGSDQEVNNKSTNLPAFYIDKIFEKLVHSRLISFLDKHKVLSNKLFGFRKRHSTTLSLISLTEEIGKALDSGHYSCGIFIDLQKACNTVDHNILLKKLSFYGNRGIANNLFSSYFLTENNMLATLILI